MTKCTPGNCPKGQTCKRATKICEATGTKTRKNKKMSRSKSNSLVYKTASPKMSADILTPVIPAKEIITKYVSKQGDYFPKNIPLKIDNVSKYRYTVHAGNTFMKLHIYTADTFADLLKTFYDNDDDGASFLSIMSTIPFKKMYAFLSENSDEFKKIFPKFKLYNYYYEQMAFGYVDDYKDGDPEPKYDEVFEHSKLKNIIETIGKNRVIDFIVKTTLDNKFSHVDCEKVKYKNETYLVDGSLGY